MKPVIVHISNDYPDPLVPDKTRAVRALVEGTADDFRHIVYSLNRINGFCGISALPFGEENTALSYKALPKGLLWEKRLPEVARWIEADIRRRGIVPNLIEAHKFTVEGVIGLDLSYAFGVPLVVDIQGDTDTKVLKNKKRLLKTYRDIAETAAVVFPYAPWPVSAFESRTGLDRDKCRLLPVVPGIDALSSAPVITENKLVTVFNIDSWKRKNITGVTAAIDLLAKKYPDLTLDLYGRGSPAAITAMKKAIAGSLASGRVRMKGVAENGKLPELLKDYAAFIQPSLRESYGLVYAEALFAGLPVVFSKDRGIDGYLPTADIGYAADPHSPEDIARGIDHVLTRQAQLKQSIARLQEKGSLDILRKPHILSVYRQGLFDALAA